MSRKFATQIDACSEVQPVLSLDEENADATIATLLNGIKCFGTDLRTAYSGMPLGSRPQSDREA